MSSRIRLVGAPAFALGLALVIAAGCAPAAATADDVLLEFSVQPEPCVGDSTCTLRLVDEAGAPIRGASLRIEGNMNHAGMVPVFADAVEVADGTYRAPLRFTMGGDWFVIVSGTLPDGREFEETREVPGVKSAPRGTSEEGTSEDPEAKCCSTADDRAAALDPR